MFPPIEDAVLQNNPKFAALHKTLTTRILNPDGSSKNFMSADRDATTEVRPTACLPQTLPNALLRYYTPTTFAPQSQKSSAQH
jgi:hypothetical protein